MAENNNEEDIKMSINNGSTQKVNDGFEDQVLTYLISAKEKIIDLVFEISDKSEKEQIICLIYSLMKLMI